MWVMNVLNLESVSKKYPGGGEVLSGLDLGLGTGESVAVVGSSGCGKSTLLNILGTLDLATSGTVKLFGEDVAGKSDVELAELRARRVGFIFQLHHLLPQCSVMENVLVPSLALPEGERADEARARGLLERVGMGHRADALPGTLSGGERQRAAVVRALINSPGLLLADEPTGALDAENAASLVALLKELQAEEGLAVVMVTHDRELAGKMDSVKVLEGGKLV